MPRIQLKQPGQPVANFSVSGTVVTVEGVVIDCAARQSDVTEIVEVRNNGGQAEIGGDGAYLAHIEIPPKTSTESDEEASQAAAPLDHNAILITLWPTA